MFTDVIIAVIVIIIFIIFVSNYIHSSPPPDWRHNINTPNVTSNCGACRGASWLLHIEGCPLYNKNDECPVCMSNLANSVIQCGHSFCSECLSTIKNQTNICPMCSSILM